MGGDRERSSAVDTREEVVTVLTGLLLRKCGG